MMTEICAYLKNWFDRDENGRDLPKHRGRFTIKGGVIEGLELLNGQYFRIVDSRLNNGVYEYAPVIEGLRDETFEGAIWEMAVPVDVRRKAKKIADWEAKYGTVDSAALSPYNSENFGIYAYSKSGGGGLSGGSAMGWQGIFGGQLVRYKKL